MTNHSISFVGRLRCFLIPVVAFSLLSPFGTQAQPFTLTHKNTTINISSSSMHDWIIDGVDQVNHHWFYYGIGSGTAESPIQTLDATPTVNSYQNLSSFSRVDLTYANADYSVRTLYHLVGGNAGSGRSTLSQTLTVANTSASSIVFRFFQLSDFDLGGIAGGQSVDFLLNDVTGQYYKAIQTGAGGSVTATITSGAPPVGGQQAGIAPFMVGSLTDGSETTLNGNLSAGPGNAEFAWMWSVPLAPGETFQISEILAVPEPSSIALLLCGLGAVALARRRR